MRREKNYSKQMGARIAGGFGRSTGAFLGGKVLGDGSKDIKGMNPGWALGLVGMTIQVSMPNAGGQFIGGLLEGPLNGLLWDKGKDY